jgi:hypothetical protein
MAGNAAAITAVRSHRADHLIPCHNARKGCAAIADKVRQTVIESAGRRTDVRAADILLSADPGDAGAWNNAICAPRLGDR